MSESFVHANGDEVVEATGLRFNVTTADLFWEGVEDPVNVGGEYAPVVLRELLLRVNQVVRYREIDRAIRESGFGSPVSASVLDIQADPSQLKVAQRHIRKALIALRQLDPGFPYELRTRRKKGWRLVRETPATSGRS